MATQTSTRLKLNLLNVFVLTTFGLSTLAVGLGVGLNAVQYANIENGGGGPPSATGNLVGYYYYSTYSTPASTSPAVVPTEAFYDGPGSANHGLRAEYFSNDDLQGTPRTTTTDPNIDWYPPDGTMNRLCLQCFGRPERLTPNPLLERSGSVSSASVRWTGEIALPAGQTTFYVVADDGVRLYLNGTMILDLWPRSGVVSPGAHLISDRVVVNRPTAGRIGFTLEYAQLYDLAGVQLGWKSGSGGFPHVELGGVNAAIPQTPGGPASPNYAANLGSPDVGTGEAIDYPVFNPRLNAITGSPNGDRTAVQYYPWILAEQENDYRLYVNTNDGFGLWNRATLETLASWELRTTTQEFSRQFHLTPGWHQFGLTFFQKDGPAALQLGWAAPNAFPKTYPIPNTHIRNTPPTYCTDGTPLNTCSTATVGQFCDWWGTLAPHASCQPAPTSNPDSGKEQVAP
ncbi:MAG: hypothetical protein HYZ09_01075 [Candidatus Kerfeldbacteria bacterium]|nr:hypothetical protein [Candidatus Kerfeldbacteria bacterium]